MVMDFGILPSSGKILSLVHAFSCSGFLGRVPVAMTILGAVNCSALTVMTWLETKEASPSKMVTFSLNLLQIGRAHV